MSNITHAYLGGLVHKRGDDGFLYVTGLVSDDTLDLDQQRCDPSWLDVSVPQWMKSAGNVRLMHQPTAVGKAKEISKKGTGWDALIKVTNPQVATDIEEGVLTGLSVGIKNARVEKSLLAPNGLIVGGDIIEVSLVDRPANPSCVIEMAKMDGDWQFTGIDVNHSDQMDVRVSSPITPEGLEPGEGWVPKPDAPLGEDESDEDLEDASDAQENVQDAETVLALDDQKAAKVCATCKGKGTIMDGNRDCPDCDGPAKSVQPDADVVQDDELAKAIGLVFDMLPFEATDVLKAKLSGAAINDLPDSAFAYIEPGGKKDAEGKTTPRSLRHFPVHDKAHARNALSRAPQSPFGDKAMPKIKAACKKFGIQVSAKAALDELLTKMATPPAGGWKHDPDDIKDIVNGICDLAIAELDEMKEGEDERNDVRLLMGALDMMASWACNEVQNDEIPPLFTSTQGDDDMANAYVSLGVSPDLIKSATAEDATDELKTELKTELRKALGFEEDVINKAQITELQESVETLKAALEEVQEMAAPGGPVLRQTSDQRRTSAAHDAITSKAAEIRARAETVFDPSLKQALKAEADKLDAALSSL